MIVEIILIRNSEIRRTSELIARVIFWYIQTLILGEIN